MGRRSWLHFLYSSELAYYLEDFIKKDDTIFIVGSALINGTIQSYDGHMFGQKGKMSLILLSQSDGNYVVEKMVKNGLTDFFQTVLLDSLNSKDIEHGEDGTKIKYAKYLTQEEYYQEVDKLPEYEQNDMGLAKIMKEDDVDILEQYRSIIEKRILGKKFNHFYFGWFDPHSIIANFEINIDSNELLLFSTKDIYRY